MKALIMSIILLFGIQACGYAPIKLEAEIEEKCKKIDRVEVCEATQAYWMIGKMQERVNEAHADGKISDETHAARSKLLRQATGNVIAWEVGEDNYDKVLNLLETNFKYLVSIGFNPRVIFN